MPTCRACGAHAPDDARFCPTCGTYFDTPAPPGPAPSGYVPLPTAPPPSPPMPGPYGGLPQGPPKPLRPLGVTIMALWDLGAGLVLALFGLAVAVFTPIILEDPQMGPDLRQQLAQLPPDFPVSTAFAAAGVVMLLMGLAMAAIGVGLYRGRNWSLLGMLGLSAFWAVLNLVSVLGGNGSGVLALGLAVFLLWYFTRPGVKRWFGRELAPEPGLPGYVPPPMPPTPPSY